MTHGCSRRTWAGSSHDLPEDEVLRVGCAGPGPIVDQAPWTQGVDLAVHVLVERVLDRELRPHHPAHFGLRTLHPVVCLVLRGFHRSMTTVDQLLQTPSDVAHLTLGMEDEAAAAGQVRARAVHAE